MWRSSLRIAPLADSVVLSGCQRCPDRARLAVLDPLGNTIDIDTEDCIPATKYSIVLVEPDAPEMQISWSVDGVLQPGFTTTEFSYDLSEGEVVEISVAMLIDGCPVLSDAITLVACDCPDETLGITVTDTAGNTVNTVGCVNSGVYFLEATGGDLENVDLQWSAGATPLGNGTQATITFDGSAIGGCCFLRTTPPSTTVTVTAANADPNCPDRSGQRNPPRLPDRYILHRLLAVAIGNHIFRNYLGDGSSRLDLCKSGRQSVDPPNRGLGCNCSVGRASCSGHRHSDHHRHFTLLVVVLPPNMVR